MITGISGRISTILGYRGAVSRDDTMFVVKVYCKIETSSSRSYSKLREFWIRFSYVMMTSIEVSMFLGAKYLLNE